MEVITFTRNCGKSTEFRLYPIGDMHLGTKHCAEHLLKKQIKEIQEEKNALWIGMGDYAEFITQRDPRWDTSVVSDWVNKEDIPMSQVDYVCDLFEPIKDKCIGLLEGNHEDAVRVHNDVDVFNRICKGLGATPLGYSCFVRMTFIRSGGSNSFIGFFSHGAGWAITKGSKVNRLQRLMDSFEADIYAIGHMHDIITDTKPYLTLADNNEIKQAEKVGAVTGSWFKTYAQGVRASYGEKKNYPPTILGCPVFIIVPHKQILRVES